MTYRDREFINVDKFSVFVDDFQTAVEVIRRLGGAERLYKKAGRIVLPGKGPVFWPWNGEVENHIS